MDAPERHDHHLGPDDGGQATDDVAEADRRDGEPGALDERYPAERARPEGGLDRHPEPGDLPSDVDVQAERQPEDDHPQR